MKVSMIALTLAACVAGSVAHAAVLPAPAADANSSQSAPVGQPQWSANAAGVAPKTRAQVVSGDASGSFVPTPSFKFMPAKAP